MVMKPEVPLKSVYRGHHPSGVHVDTRSGRLPSKAVDLRGDCQEALEGLDKGLSFSKWRGGDGEWERHLASLLGSLVLSFTSSFLMWPCGSDLHVFTG